MPPYSYTWFDNQNNQLSTTANQSITYIGNYYCLVYDSQHCQSDTLVFSNHISATEDINITNVLIYPNPSDGIINIAFSSDKTLLHAIALSYKVEDDTIFNIMNICMHISISTAIIH